MTHALSLMAVVVGMVVTCCVAMRDDGQIVLDAETEQASVSRGDLLGLGSGKSKGVAEQAGLGNATSGVDGRIGPVQEWRDCTGLGSVCWDDERMRCCKFRSITGKSGTRFEREKEYTRIEITYKYAKYEFSQGRKYCLAVKTDCDKMQDLNSFKVETDCCTEV
eukprot:CAMPEP_0197883610 /NCGR_PEP_ID=MMETSP1439-20131203/10379_1 /TAXON_ID=66791 /ORGANISM="Gonyaulax spinifera, Strain CCMP409" /LENGTH=163 /DNA_ID=CAMNT_0043503337 /DNA_START=108 /DNA_END=599 /DNA_ORIENTATION=+